MDYFKSYNPEFGYNLTTKAGSMFGYKHSEETRRKISEVQIGRVQSEETKIKISEANKGENSYWYGRKKTDEHIRKCAESRKGFKQTDEAKRKISEASKGRKKTEESIRKTREANMIPIVQLDKLGNLMKEWESATTAGKELNINAKNITTCCKGKRKTVGSFIWMYKNEYEVIS